MTEKIDVSNLELLTILEERVKSLYKFGFNHSFQEVVIKNVDEVWSEYKARFEEYKKEHPQE